MFCCDEKVVYRNANCKCTIFLKKKKWMNEWKKENHSKFFIIHSFNFEVFFAYSLFFHVLYSRFFFTFERNWMRKKRKNEIKMLIVHTAQKTRALLVNRGLRFKKQTLRTEYIRGCAEAVQRCLFSFHEKFHFKIS